MEHKKTIDVEMYKVENSSIPFILVDYMDIYGIKQAGLLLIDSGANVNVLSMDCRFLYLKEDKKEITKKSSSDGSEDEIVRFSFTLDNELFEDEFLVKRHLFSGYNGIIPIIGVIGNSFMEDNNLVIDYDNHTVYTSKNMEDGVNVSECEFYFPMVYGLNNYGLPTVPLVQNNLQVLAVAQTGVMENLLSSSTLCSDGFRCEYHDYQSLALFMAEYIDCMNVTMDYGLLTVIDKEGHVGELCYKGDFKVLPHYFYTPKPEERDDKGKLLEPVEATISAEFIEKEGWILDYGINIIYKNRKQCSIVELAS